MRFQRWCCDVLKKDPTKHVPLRHRLMGIRAEESLRRAGRPRIDAYRKNQILYKPIFYWPEWAVWQFIDENNLPYPSLYDEGFGRIGCVTCPFIMGRKQLEQSMLRWPAIWRVMEKVTKNWWRMKRDTGEPWRTKDYQTAEGFWQAYLRGFEK